MKLLGLGASPSTAAVQLQQQNRAMQNSMTKRGGRRGGATVPQFSTSGVQVSATGPNDSSLQLAQLNARATQLQTAQSQTGKPASGGRRTRRRRKTLFQSIYCSLKRLFR